MRQTYYKPKGEKVGTRWALIVVRVKGASKGKPYRRTFKTERAMQDYIARQRGKEDVLMSQKEDVYPPMNPKKPSVTKDLVNWMKDGLGLEDLTEEEQMFLQAFKDGEGRNPRFWEDPFLMERGMKMLDKMFLAMTAAAGPGVAALGMKAAMQGTKLASSQLARATTKAAVKKALKNSWSAMVKKRTVGNALKVASKGTAKTAGKAMEAEWKYTVAHDFANMAVQGFKTVKKQM